MRGLSQKVLGVLLCSLFGVHVAHGDFLDYPLTNRELEIEAGYYDRSGKYLGGIPKVSTSITIVCRCMREWVEAGIWLVARRFSSDRAVGV